MPTASAVAASAAIALNPIGSIYTGFERLDDCPKSSRLNPGESVIELLPEFIDGLRDIERATHLVILYWFDRSNRSALLRRKREGEEHARGVFASRSPNRPNPIALSVVELLGCQGNRLRVSGLDCLDGTKVVDIKPYVTGIDCFPNARNG